MVIRTTPEEDEWKNVRDAKKRKQIQDRLAQRARRKHQPTGAGDHTPTVT